MQAKGLLAKIDSSMSLRLVNKRPSKRLRVRTKVARTKDYGDNLVKTLKQRRLLSQMTLDKLSAESGVCERHLARLEDGACQLSASVLRKIARPLGISEIEVITYPPYVNALNRLQGFTTRRR